jgi:hypothetical protein
VPVSDPVQLLTPGLLTSLTMASTDAFLDWHAVPGNQNRSATFSSSPAQMRCLQHGSHTQRSSPPNTTRQLGASFAAGRRRYANAIKRPEYALYQVAEHAHRAAGVRPPASWRLAGCRTSKRVFVWI